MTTWWLYTAGLHGMQSLVSNTQYVCKKYIPQGGEPCLSVVHLLCIQVHVLPNQSPPWRRNVPSLTERPVDGPHPSPPPHSPTWQVFRLFSTRRSSSQVEHLRSHTYWYPSSGYQYQASPQWVSASQVLLGVFPTYKRRFPNTWLYDYEDNHQQIQLKLADELVHNYDTWVYLEKFQARLWVRG